MLKVSKVNDRGLVQIFYTHEEYLSKDTKQQIAKAKLKYKKFNNTLFFVSSLFTYWVTNNIPVVTQFVKTKIKCKLNFLLVSIVVGFADYSIGNLITSNLLNQKRTNLIYNESFPIWYDKSRVVNPERVFFQLDDLRNNEPNIYYSGITSTGIKRLLPDANFGKIPQKPHIPTESIHQH